MLRTCKALDSIPSNNKRGMRRRKEKRKERKEENRSEMAQQPRNLP